MQSFDPRPLIALRRLEPKIQLAYLFENIGTQIDYCAETAQLGFPFASPNKDMVTPAGVARCHAQGIRVVPWTVNTEKDWERLLAAKVDGIITDYPEEAPPLSGHFAPSEIDNEFSL